MKNVKKVLCAVTALTLAVVMVFAQPIEASAATVSTDMYAQRATEEVVIDGVTYTFNYFYEDGNRVITVTNSANSIIEKVSYDPSTLTKTCYEGENGVNGTTSDWVLIGSGSQTISEFESKTVSGVASKIAIVLGFCGAAGVIAAIGFDALGDIAENSVGGTVYITTYSMYVPYQGTQYLYVWSFTTSTGKSYGPYEYFQAPGIIS